MDNLDPRWVSEFVGFFMADGCVSLDVGTQKQTLKSGKIVDQRRIKCRFRITLRDDSAITLNNIKEKLGGHIYKTPGRDKSKPTISWQVSSIKDCRKLLNLLMNNNKIPTRKAMQLPIVDEFLKIVERGPRTRSNPYTKDEIERLKFLKQVASNMKGYLKS